MISSKNYFDYFEKISSILVYDIDSSIEILIENDAYMSFPVNFIHTYTQISDAESEALGFR
jgi:hypothetical protein